MKFSAVPHTVPSSNGWLVHPTARVPNRNLRLSRGVVRKLLNRTWNRREIRSNLPPRSRPDFRWKKLVLLEQKQPEMGCKFSAWRVQTRFSREAAAYISPARECRVS